ncbi:3-keto-5-aminohexanoate cleavage protein [Streptomyces sp. NPDC026672]|uniref:3-keto-5-aminohexanoate cleavage protein n=1 Tax=unclassified Streptomyces TaxID=2593676 RepID=UPI0033FF2C72
MADRKVILTIAPTGGMADKSISPHLPTQPEEIADDVARCWEAGASIVALHARRPDDGATCDPEIYRRINDLVRSRCDIVINNSTGGGISGDMISTLPDGRREISFEQRIKGTLAGAEMCTFDPQMQCMHRGDLELLMDTSWSRCLELAQAMKDRGIKPEWEVMSLSDLVWVKDLIALGYDEPPHYVNIVLGTHKLMSGATPYTPRDLQRFVEDLPADSLFCVSGIGPAQLPSSVHSLILGGQARVGLEDNIYYSRGRLATNVELVERMVRILHELNLEPATPAEAREMLGLSQPAVTGLAAPLG